MERYKLIPAQRGANGWLRSWTVDGKQAAIDSAKEFFGETGIGVLLMLTDDVGRPQRPWKIVKRQARDLADRPRAR